MNIRVACLADWEEIKRIYIDGIRTKLATFETECTIKGGEDWFSSKISGSVFVLTEAGKILGWSALSPISDRCVYGGVAEVSVYVDNASKGKGAGFMLLEKLIEFAESNNIWTLQAGIFGENTASIKLHEKCGFRIVGIREKLGKLDNEWKDVTFMEKRSEKIF